MAEEFTFALIKSHIATDHPALVEAVLTRIVRSGLAIRQLCYITPTSPQIHILYREHAEKPYFPALADSVSRRTVAIVLSGENAILRWRELLGATNPATAAPDTLRANFGDHKKLVDNVAHGSDSENAARREIAIFFPDFPLEAYWPRAHVQAVRSDDRA